ncbi:MAG TPA: fumarylacetoacetate hydrolase family protein [Chitinophagaceae bacterium]|nr:fumarylacetoacetate hydrolase family protein [Chitinophagaceae bacterium]
MKVYKTKSEIIIEFNGEYFLSAETDWDVFINRDDLYAQLQKEIYPLQSAGDAAWFKEKELLAPIGSQEVWAAGVTYLRSKVARMEESRESGGATFYDKVYDAARPEIFFKANASRVVGPLGKVRIRKDSTWDVPEPELVLVISSSGKIIGYSIGNDMSSRSIEGENPLYLPQAKMYDGCAAIGPCVLVTEEAIAPSTVLSIAIERDGQVVFEGSVSIDQMKRKHAELVEYLYREYSFANGAYLMTGTSVVPDNSFTLQSHDCIKINIEGIGELVNTVA